MDSKQLQTLALYVTPALLAVLAFFVRKWMSDIEDVMKALLEESQKNKTNMAIVRERESHMRGLVDSLRKSVKETDASVTKLTSSLEKAWIVMQASGVAEARFSDNNTRK